MKRFQLGRRREEEVKRIERWNITQSRPLGRGGRVSIVHLTAGIIVLGVCLNSILWFRIDPNQRPWAEDLELYAGIRTAADYTAVKVLAQRLNLQSPTVKIHVPPVPIENCNHTVVTGYLQIPSKFSSDRYKSWMKNMLGISDCAIVFTQENMVESVWQLRQHAIPKTIVVELALSDLAISKLHYHNQNFWSDQLGSDKEKSHHKSYELFWIWLSKTWLVQQAIAFNYFQSSFYMWSDIGCFRSHMPDFLNQEMIQFPDLVPPKQLLWMAHHPPHAPPTPLWNDKFKQKKFYFHSGSQGAGRIHAWQLYHREFAIMIDRFLAADLFIGEDQCVLQGTCQQNPHLCAYVPFDQVNDNHYFGLRTVLRHGGNYTYWQFTR